jgi:hypothetical protein
VITKRVLAVIASILFVLAVALATLGPRTVSLGRALNMLDRDAVTRLQGGVESVFGPWAWAELAMPLLVRPAWLGPAALGVIFIGFSLSFGGPKATRRPHRQS